MLTFYTGHSELIQRPASTNHILLKSSRRIVSSVAHELKIVHENNICLTSFN